MASDLDDLAEPERRLCEVLAAYFEAVKAGSAPDRDGMACPVPRSGRPTGRVPGRAGPAAASDRAVALDRQGQRVGGPSFRPIDGPACRPPGHAGRRQRDGPRQAGAAVHVFGDYELIGEPTHGGMSVVYRALQRSLNRPVALKMLRRRDAGRRRRRAPVSPGGRGGRQPRPSEHRADLRGGRARRLQLLRDEADRGRKPRPETGRIPPRPEGGRQADGHGGARRPPCPPAGHPAPRSEAVEHPDRRRGPAARHRLRPGQAGRRAFRADPVGRDPGNAVLHGPRAGVGPEQGRSRRRPTSTAWAPSCTPS